MNKFESNFENNVNVNVNIKLDKDLKENFARVCNDMGMNMTTAFNIFAKAVVNENMIPFVVKGSNPIVAEFSDMESFKEYVEKL